MCCRTGPNHPFLVPAVNDYVELQDLEVGTVLRSCGGSEAMVLRLTIRKGDVEAYDLSVEGLHNFFVRGPGSDAPGVLVHNSTGAGLDDVPWGHYCRSGCEDVASSIRALWYSS